MKKFLLIAALLVTGLLTNASAQCAASFTWYQPSANQIVFTNTSISSNPNFTYYWWDFGDSQMAFSPNASHLYSAPGTYYVNLTMYDSVYNITCTFLDTVSVWGNVLCNTYAVVQQVAAATCSNCADGSATAALFNGTGPYTYAWSNGATTQTAAGLTPGSYTCCITDINGCTSCDSVIVQYASSSSCAISFNASFLSGGWVIFNATVTGANSSASVSWNFGDLTTGSGMYPWHQYAASGQYIVCATVLDSISQCTATVCDTISVNITPQMCDANFFVQLDSANPNQAWIYNLSTGSSTMTYQWLWGDNTMDTSAYASHVYQQTGSYNLCLIVVDAANSCTDTMCQLLLVPRLTQQAAQVPFYVNVVPPVFTGIADPAVSQQWSLYPNPAGNELNAGGDLSANATYLITDVSGRTVMSGTLTVKTMDVSSLQSGVYIFTLVHENGLSESKRFIRN